MNLERFADTMAGQAQRLRELQCDLENARCSIGSEFDWFHGYMETLYVVLGWFNKTRDLASSAYHVSHDFAKEIEDMAGPQFGLTAEESERVRRVRNVIEDVDKSFYRLEEAIIVFFQSADEHLNGNHPLTDKEIHFLQVFFDSAFDDFCVEVNVIACLVEEYLLTARHAIELMNAITEDGLMA